eukprot:scaffold99_cov193-Alexandrium_tamarense.AAC.2
MDHADHATSSSTSTITNLLPSALQQLSYLRSQKGTTATRQHQHPTFIADTREMNQSTQIQ